MHLVLKQVGDIALMDAEGTPEELAAFVALIDPRLDGRAVMEALNRGVEPARIQAINSALRQSTVLAEAQAGLMGRRAEGVA